MSTLQSCKNITTYNFNCMSRYTVYTVRTISNISKYLEARAANQRDTPKTFF